MKTEFFLNPLLGPYPASRFTFAVLIVDESSSGELSMSSLNL